MPWRLKWKAQWQYRPRRQRPAQRRRCSLSFRLSSLVPSSSTSSYLTLSSLPTLSPSLSLHSKTTNHSYGYDPLGLGKDAEGVEKYRANELLHARWAMLGAAGTIIPEGLKANGADLRGATWFDAPFELANSGSLTYFAVPWGIITNPLPLAAVAAINVALIAAVERFRASGEGPAGYSPGVGKFDASVFDGLDPLYPGGPFDPLGLADDPETLEELKVKEIKNGRLAMGKEEQEEERNLFFLSFFSFSLSSFFFVTHPPPPLFPPSSLYPHPPTHSRHARLLDPVPGHRTGPLHQLLRPHRRPLRQQPALGRPRRRARTDPLEVFSLATLLR